VLSDLRCLPFVAGLDGFSGRFLFFFFQPLLFL
jgi:hypothetical protein